MSLILRRTSQWWYGYYRMDGKAVVVPLAVRVAGKRPASLREVGDALFEQSRGAAKVKHDEMERELRDKRNLGRLTERLIEIKTGDEDPTGFTPLDELPRRWSETRHKRGKNTKYAEECKVILERFVTFIREKHPAVKELLLVTAPIAKAFMQAEESRRVVKQSRRVSKQAKPVRDEIRSVTSRTWNNTFKLLKGAFRYLAPDSSAYKHYFCKVELKEEAAVHRQPYSPADLKAILEAAQDDDFIRPIIVTGICTAMRRGDCCQLKWSDVNFETKFVSVSTAKTNAKIWIPMFGPLREELRRQKRDRSEFVFPEQAAMYDRNPDEITARVQAVLEKAGFKDGPQDGRSGSKKKSHQGEPPKPAGRGALHQSRTEGIRQASIRDFHSFRVTWITLALAAGVPIELVRKVTGHASVETVLKNYFQPNREHFRTILQTALPAFLVGKVIPRNDQIMREILEKSTAATWEADRKCLLELLNHPTEAGLFPRLLPETKPEKAR